MSGGCCGPAVAAAGAFRLGGSRGGAEHVGGDRGQRGGGSSGRRRREPRFLPEPPRRRRQRRLLRQLLPGGLGVGSGGRGAGPAAAPPAGESDGEIRSEGAAEAAGAGGVDRGAAGAALRLRGAGPGSRGPRRGCCRLSPLTRRCVPRPRHPPSAPSRISAVGRGALSPPPPNDIPGPLPPPCRCPAPQWCLGPGNGERCPMPYRKGVPRALPR